MLGVSSETRQLAKLAEAIPLAGIRVVVVDDNLTNRRILSDMLWGWGMLPAPAASGPEALAHMRRGAPARAALQPGSDRRPHAGNGWLRAGEADSRDSGIDPAGDSDAHLRRPRRRYRALPETGDFVLSHQAGSPRRVAYGDSSRRWRTRLRGQISPLRPSDTASDGPPKRSLRELPHSSHRGQRCQSARRPADSGEGRAHAWPSPKMGRWP